ncbi:hypothetical protein AVEN_50340-1 [Araneus ventricosus]|uniref:Uncharacterized protein n=1 Tax=Araneus ventricosus TaxID=182803 RepID=A0A4Y2E8A7_ARAVE|nr:hypothetical protein AVEN_50340-1 [Araneus ventricosus]
MEKKSGLEERSRNSVPQIFISDDSWRRSLSEVRLMSCHGTAKNPCCSRVLEMTRPLRRNFRKYSDIRGCNSMDGYLSTVPTVC